jgi:hypothetical protein
MKTVIKKEEVTFTCNECGLSYNEGNIALEEIDDR